MSVRPTSAWPRTLEPTPRLTSTVLGAAVTYPPRDARPSASAEARVTHAYAPLLSRTLR
jgi:hypothetical protein